jgi:hypothetical protein
MMLWFVTAVLTMALVPYLAPMSFLSFVPPMAYFAVFYFENQRKSWLAETAFGLSFALMLLLFYQGLLSLIPGAQLGQLTSLRVQKTSLPAAIRNEPILVIGEDLSAYRDNRPATPYLNWDLAQYDLKNLDNYQAVVHVFDNFRNDPPTFIIDREQVVSKLFQRIPALAARYEKTAYPDVYKLK